MAFLTDLSARLRTPRRRRRTASSPAMSPTLVVNNIELAYIDSGPPPAASVYTTIFAVHGLEFTSPIFQKVSALSRSKGLRFVAITRRGYNGSTPFSPADTAILTTGDNAQKTTWLNDRGFEIAAFVDAFIQREHLPPISTDGKTGGIALLGWSSGNTFTAAAIANIDALSPPAQSRFASHLRAHIMQEPPSIAFGLPLPPQTFTPQLDTSIPAAAQVPAFTLWITAYFQHGDLATRDPAVLEYVLPARTRAPSIWNMSAAEIAQIVDEGPNIPLETPFAIGFMAQARGVYEKATFDKAARGRVPHMKVWEITGDMTASFSLAAFWSIQDDDEAHGGGNVNYKVVPGANHFMHWDDPETTVDAYLEALI